MILGSSQAFMQITAIIEGAGDIASILKLREGALFFASGVSNSQCTDEEQFKREKHLLLSQPKDLCIFYFSTISIYTKDSPYTTHKKAMEQIIRSNWNHYNILRLGNITFGKNPNTFINYVRARKAAGEPYILLDDWRWVIDEEGLLLLTNNLPLKGQNEMNVFTDMGKAQKFI